MPSKVFIDMNLSPNIFKLICELEKTTFFHKNGMCAFVTQMPPEFSLGQEGRFYSLINLMLIIAPWNLCLPVTYTYVTN